MHVFTGLIKKPSSIREQTCLQWLIRFMLESLIFYHWDQILLVIFHKVMCLFCSLLRTCPPNTQVKTTMVYWAVMFSSRHSVPWGKWLVELVTASHECFFLRWMLYFGMQQSAVCCWLSILSHTVLKQHVLKRHYLIKIHFDCFIKDIRSFFLFFFPFLFSFFLFFFLLWVGGGKDYNDYRYSLLLLHSLFLPRCQQFHPPVFCMPLVPGSTQGERQMTSLYY